MFDSLTSSDFNITLKTQRHIFEDVRDLYFLQDKREGVGGGGGAPHSPKTVTGIKG